MPVSRICLVCQSPFSTLSYEVKKGWGKYCSKACANKAQTTRVSRICLACQTPFEKGMYAIRNGGGKYCSIPCSIHHRTTMPCIVTRFWSHVRKTDDCWLWCGPKNAYGYGTFNISANPVRAHRFAYELTYGLILPGLLCCHHCDVRLCVRPEHLFLGTNGDNLRDMSSKGRSGAHVHPETLARGDRNGSRMHPERYPRGEQHISAKLTDAQVIEIRRLYTQTQTTYHLLALRYGVSLTLIAKIVRREVWKHLL